MGNFIKGMATNTGVVGEVMISAMIVFILSLAITEESRYYWQGNRTSRI